ncbi:MAG TPA: orotidine-5'-phosphate decarboxylase [Solirubrobacteraceae bacterium]
MSGGSAGGAPAPSGGAAAIPFGERLAAAVAARETNIVVGLDPDPERLWPVEVADAPGAPAVAMAVLAHCKAVIDAVAEHVVAVKLQIACFERLGPAGTALAVPVMHHARQHGLLVIADAKRGDIDVTARAYAEAWLAPLPGFGADAMTASPYMGADTLQPLLDVGRPHGAGIFVLVRTSNPGAQDIEDLALADGGHVWERVAAIVDDLGQGSPKDVGAVVGATAPEHLARARELMPQTPFLLPGVGAQGGKVEDLAPAFAPGPAGGLITASRSIVGAHESAGGTPADAARAEAERLRALAWALA